MDFLFSFSLSLKMILKRNSVLVYEPQNPSKMHHLNGKLGSVREKKMEYPTNDIYMFERKL